MIRRREFITLLGGAAAWPLAAHAQQGGRMRRIGVLLAGDENDPEQKRRLSAFTQALAELGWTDGRNVRMDLRWGGGDISRIRAFAQELVGLKPDIILAVTSPVTASANAALSPAATPLVQNRAGALSFAEGLCTARSAAWPIEPRRGQGGVLGGVAASAIGDR
jgi:putative ABC transport system substrate-binding protein